MYTLIHYFNATVEQYPNRVAIIDGENSISFGQLQQKVRGLSSHIRKLVRCNKIIAVFLPKSIDSITCDIAINDSQNAYMNLDIRQPDMRIQNILKKIKPSLIITNKKLLKKLQLMTDSIPILLIEDTNEKASTKLTINNGIDSDLLCVINTSGSTGTPKGVALTHRGFIDRIKSEERVGILDDKLEIVASLAPPVFDHHSFEICLLMMRAATLLIIPESLAAFPIRILELIKKHQATFLLWVPTIMVNIANMDLLSVCPLPSLKKIWFAGEIFPTPKFNYWKKHLQNAQFVNLYGPTEISVDCTYFIVNRTIKDEEPIPIGFALPNTDVLILNNHDQLAKPNEDGEICVRGSCIAQGYYNDPEKTNEVFVQNPLHKNYPDLIYRTGDVGYFNENKEIVFKGRKDTLIKHMGYRIELSEIEHIILSTSTFIQNCCVVYDKETSEHGSICLFYESQFERNESELKIEFAKYLPRYMIPNRYIYQKELPRNNNGKIDRLQLKETLSNLS